LGFPTKIQEEFRFAMEGGNNQPRKISSGLSAAKLLLGTSATEPVLSSGVEWDESEVVWSGDYEETAKEPQIISGLSGISLSNGSSSIGGNRNGSTNNVARRRVGIEQGVSGLSVALVDDRRSLGRSSLSRNPASLAMARMIPAGASVKPRSSDEYSGSARMYHRSAPVNVPPWSKNNQSSMKPQLTANPGLEEVEDDDENDEERLPPHEITAREHARTQMTTFSMCEGLGRTLKGRDQSRVRNAVWRQTGFLD